MEAEKLEFANAKSTSGGRILLSHFQDWAGWLAWLGWAGLEGGGKEARTHTPQ